MAEVEMSVDFFFFFFSAAQPRFVWILDAAQTVQSDKLLEILLKSGKSLPGQGNIFFLQLSMHRATTITFEIWFI